MTQAVYIDRRCSCGLKLLEWHVAVAGTIAAASACTNCDRRQCDRCKVPAGRLFQAGPIVCHSCGRQL